MTEKPKNSEITDINLILDEIMAREGLSSRYEARRWLIESQDALKRRRLTRGHRTRLISIASESGMSGGKRMVILDNPHRKLISASGHTLPAKKRTNMEPPAIPEIIIPPAPLGFQAALQEIQANKIPHKTKTQKQRAEERLARQRSGEREIHIPRARSDKGVRKLKEPMPGTDSRLVYDTLVKHDWNRALALAELKQHPKFTTRLENEPWKISKVIGAQLTMITKRYRA